MLQENTETNGNWPYNYTNSDRISVDAIAKKLGPRFAERAARSDEGDLFVAENFAELKTHGLVAAAVPKRCQPRRACWDVARTGPLLRLHCASVFHAHASGRDRYLALALPKGSG